MYQGSYLQPRRRRKFGRTASRGGRAITAVKKRPVDSNIATNMQRQGPGPRMPRERMPMYNSFRNANIFRRKLRRGHMAPTLLVSEHVGQASQPWACTFAKTEGGGIMGERTKKGGRRPPKLPRSPGQGVAWGLGELRAQFFPKCMAQFLSKHMHTTFNEGQAKCLR